MLLQVDCRPKDSGERKVAFIESITKFVYLAVTVNSMKIVAKSNLE
jgi:hypothetical protein